MDLAILASELKSEALGTECIGKETFIAVSSPEWAQRHLSKPWSLEQLQEKSVVAYDESLPLINNFFLQLTGSKYEKRASVTVPDLRILLKLVLEGHGFSILPHYMCREHLANHSLVQLVKPKNPPENTFYLVWPKTNLRDPRVALVRNHLLNANFDLS